MVGIFVEYDELYLYICWIKEVYIY